MLWASNSLPCPSFVRTPHPATIAPYNPQDPAPSKIGPNPNAIVCELVTSDLPIGHTSSSSWLDVQPSLHPPPLWEPDVDAHDNYILTALISAVRHVLNDPFPTTSDDREALLYDPWAPLHSSTANIYMQHAENILAALSPGYAELSASEMIAFVSDVNFTAPGCGYCGEEDLTVGEILVSLERGMEEVGARWLEMLLIAAEVQGLGTGLRLEEVVRRAAEVYRRSDVARELQPFSRQSDEGKCKDFVRVEQSWMGLTGKIRKRTEVDEIVQNQLLRGE